MKNVVLLLLLTAASAAAAADSQDAQAVLPVVMAPPAYHGHSVQAQASKPATEPIKAVPAAPESVATTTGTPTIAAGGCPPDGALFLPTGYSFPAVLPDAIYSYNVGAPVMALIEDDVKFRSRLVLPRGTRLVGTASTLHTLDRVNINWELAVLPEGCEFHISALALSADDGSAGIKGKLEKHEDSVAAQIALKSMLGAAGTAAAAVSPTAPLEGALASNFTNEANQNVDQSLAKVKALESIYVRERTQIRVFVLRRFSRPGEGR